MKNTMIRASILIFCLIAGMTIGAYIGLVLGGTFLGGFDIHLLTGLEGYEITTYIGAFIGGIVGIIIGTKIKLKIINK